MRGTATAGMLSAAVLLAPGCGPTGRADRNDDSVERASFRTASARDFLASCPAGARRAETLHEDHRWGALKQLAAGKDLDHSVWLGENRWNGVARYSDRERCLPGEEAYREALAAYRAALDDLAERLAEPRQ